MTNELIATIHFIGLALFTPAVAPEHGVRALLPRVESTTHQHQTDTRQRAVSRTITPTTTTTTTTSTTLTPTSRKKFADLQMEVPAHEAWIVFDEKDYLHAVRWQVVDVPAAIVKTTTEPVRYRMVRLDGEHVTFHATGQNALVAATSSSLELPKLTCGSSLVSNGPVAAVVSIPDGQLSTCIAQFADPPEDRYDTRLALRNNGAITIWAQSAAGAKALVLRGSATVYVANVPAELIRNGTSVMTGGAHYQAYYDLVAAIRDCTKKLEPPATLTARTCPQSAFRLAGDLSSWPTRTGEIINSECSNSTWP